MPVPLLTPEEAAVRLGVSVAALEAMRLAAFGPRYLNLGSNRAGPIRYRVEDVEAYLKARPGGGR